MIKDVESHDLKDFLYSDRENLAINDMNNLI